MNHEQVIDWAVRHALHSFAGGAGRWDARRESGLTDAELREAVGFEFGTGGASTHGVRYETRGGPRITLWRGGVETRLHGRRLLDRVRRIMDIQTPQELARAAAQPGLFGEALNP